jgi:hypothetical protein
MKSGSSGDAHMWMPRGNDIDSFREDIMTVARQRVRTGLALGVVVATLSVSFGSHEVNTEAFAAAVTAPSSLALAAAADPVIAAAGDIACDPTSSGYNGGAGTSGACRQRYVSDLLVAMNPAAVLALGDNQYYCGGLSAFQQVYDPTWGRLKANTYPVVGNHEYLTSGGTGCSSENAGAAGYFDYFGSAAGQRGKGWYSFDVGNWHLIAINSNCGDVGGCSASSAQGQWLAADLASHQNLCTLAYWHIPLFSSGGRAASNTRSIWQQLSDAGADVAFTGHDHIYERFARQTSTGTRDDRAGIREFVVGTGGANHTSLSTTAANSEVRNATTFGVVKLTLHPDSYDWQFVREGSGTFSDSGSETCHGKPTDTTPPTQPTNLSGTATDPGRVDLSWTASTDTTGVSNYTVSRNGVQVGTSKTPTYSDTTGTPGTTYSYTVTATDYNGWSSVPSAPISVTVPADTTPPSTPTGLAATSIEPDRVTVAWSASTDDSAVSFYRIFRNGVLVGTSPTTTYTDTTAQPATTYSYAVSAVDRANNESAWSAPVTVTTPARPTTLVSNPVADTYVRADQASSSFGTSTVFGVDGSPVKRTLLKFNVSGVAGRPVRTATLRLWCVDDSDTGGTLHRVPSTTWTEAVTWNTAPTADTAATASVGSVKSGTWYAFDVTSLVRGDGSVAMDITSTSSNGVDYSSREAPAAQQPQLVVTTG